MESFSSSFLESRTHSFFDEMASRFMEWREREILKKWAHQALRESQYWPLIDLEAYQKEMVDKILNYARQNIPFWQRKLKRIKSLKNIAPMTKKDFRSLPIENFLAKDVSPASTPWGRTSGSTGVPFVFYVDRRSSPWRKALYRRVQDWGGKKDSDLPIRILNADRTGLSDEGIFIPCIGPEELKKKKKSIYKILAKNTVVLEGFVSYLLFLARLIEKDKPPFSIRFVIASSEFLDGGVRDYLKKIFKVPVFNCYSSRETGYIATECQYHNGFHIHAENNFLEILDDKDRVLPPGRIGNITITTFDNLVMPLIRYQIGDIGRFIKDPCPCGRTLPRIKFEGRKFGWLSLPRGRIGHIFEFLKPISSRPEYILQYKAVQESINRISLFLVPTQAFNANIKKEIIKEVESYLGPKVELIVREVKEIPTTSGGKQHYFESRVEPKY